MQTTLSVSDITRLIKINLENEFSDIVVEGEISNLKKHASGHWYLNLKDSEAVICCVMWRSMTNYVFFSPQDGMKIIITGKLTVYPPRGNYQLDVRSMKPAGEGELQAAFDRLKRKLSEEGLFDVQFKKPITRFPKKIGIVTAIDGAAFQDMISVAQRRYPLVKLIIYSARVQGEGAAKSIVHGIKEFNKRRDIDVLIIGRGGGSLEDLWAFNEEVVARAIFDSKIPIISAVGHEVDFTISDFVADFRAPTPSAAMECATPDQEDIFGFIREFSIKSTRNISYIIESKKLRIDNCLNKYGFRIPLDKVRIRMQQIDNLVYRIQQRIERNIEILNNKVSILGSILESNNVNKILKKGFAVVKQDSKIIIRAEKFNDALPATVKFYDGEISLKKNDN